ncbi:peripheral-type benzodiazepine receptor-associated protein 1 isoform X7 [Monodelphis domestica]|uniref:peripheral-type benzodiazepine receptor-associated protein 1 isoform X7 n=1 Tax=Monodelphis domestica TaxID=13616 RepID=UPI0024E1C2AE|nr:peripheral-type benzodiazepine receptor-associated protein 1 isoform X7 [Monodelphis domestica]
MPLVLGPGVLQCHRGSEPPSPAREKGEQGAMEPQALPTWPGWGPSPGGVPGSTAPMWGDALVALEAEEMDPEDTGSPGQMEDTPSGGEGAVSPRANSLSSATQLPESPGSIRRRLQCWGTENPCQTWLDSGGGVRPNMELLRALGEMQRQCAILKEENQQLRKSSFPETEEKVRRLKRKNAELAVIAKRLEERAHKLQEANLLMVNAPMPRPGASLELARKVLASQRARDLSETASALLAKDKQIAHLQRECQELQARLSSEGKEGPQWLNVWDFDRLLRESQQEVLRLQRQIALRNLQEVPPTGSPSPLDTRVLPPAPGAPGEAVPLARSQDDVDLLPEGALLAEPESQQRVKQLELELGKKRKKWETLEHEVRKKQRRCEELELQLRKAQSENARLLEENSRLSGRASGKEEVESENVELRGRLQGVTEERDSALRKSQGLQSKLESLEQVLKHMREVAQRRQQLELEHEQARIGLQEKQEEVLRLQQAQAQAKREHEGAVQLLETTLDSMQARVRELEEQCRSQTERFSLLAQELQAFRTHPGPLDLLSSTLGTSSTELPPVPCCCSTPQPCRGPSPKDVDLPPGSPRHGALRAPEAVSIAHSGAPRRASRKAESLSNSSRSESIHNSPKSCPTPEVDTASEVEELEADSVSLLPEPEGVFRGAKLQVFLARYSYNPFEGPNENPEAELPLTAGEYIYIYGNMDEDGFFEGELMDGRRGLVPSNFVERVSDDDLMTSLPPELMDLSHSSGPELSFLSAGGAGSSGGQSSRGGSQARQEEERNELSPSPLLDPPAVPYPRHLAVLKQLAHSVVLTWEPPLDGAEVQGYHVCVDGKLHQALGPGPPRKAVLEHPDLQSGSCCVSVQALTSQGSSDPLRCCLMVGAGAGVAPSQLRVHRLTATSAEITWVPSNSNFAHAVYLNGEECPPARPGTYWGTFCHLRPGTPYQARVEARPITLRPLEPSLEKLQNRAAVVHFTTLAAGPPDAPLDVQIEQGPSSGILLISWLPVTIDAAGSSNGVRVTGYAIYADGQKIMEVASPTAGSVLVDLSQLQLLRECREVVVRTMSPHGESVDSIPAHLPPALALAYPPAPVLRPSAASLLPSTSPEAKSLPCPASLSPRDSSPPPQPHDPPGSRDVEGGLPSSPSKTAERLPQEDSTRNSQQEEPGVPTAAVWAPGGKRGQDTGPPLSGKEEEEEEAVMAEKGQGESALTPSPAPGAPAEKMSGIEPGRGEISPGLRTRAEQREDTSDLGVRLTNSLVDHGRSSDLSDIQEEEEEEEEEPGAESFSLTQHGETNDRENGAKTPEARELRGQDAAGQRGPSRKGSRPPRLSAPELAFSRNQTKEISPPNEPVRIFVALFDYDPVSMSPNPDAVEEELPFREGQLLKVCGEKDADGFYRGECGGRVGYVPCNMVAEVAVGSPVVKRQLLQRGYLHPDSPKEGLGNGSFPLLAPHPAGPPPKPRRSKKGSSSQPDVRASPSTPHSMVAAFDYNPRENSPNVDVEAELSFKAGDVITVFGAMDDDGFYYGELNGQRGLVPSNFLEGVISGEDRKVVGPSKEKDPGVLMAESQLQSATAPDLTGPLPCPSHPPSLRPGSTLEARSEESLAPAKKMRGLISKGKHLLRKLGSGKKE